jgi:hypothetical protein
MHIVRRIVHGWIAIELSAGIVSLCLLVAVLPMIVCLMALPPEWSLGPALGAGANGAIGAAYLGRAALRIPAELLMG